VSACKRNSPSLVVTNFCTKTSRRELSVHIKSHWREASLVHLKWSVRRSCPLLFVLCQIQLWVRKKRRTVLESVVPFIERHSTKPLRKLICKTMRINQKQFVESITRKNCEVFFWWFLYMVVTILWILRWLKEKTKNVECKRGTKRFIRQVN
jgi:hypothetical protein